MLDMTIRLNRFLFSALALIAFVVLVGLMSGCAEEPKPPLRVGTNLWPGYEPLYLAERLGQWQREQVRLVAHPSASEVLRSFRNKSLEAAALTLDEALGLLQSGIPVQVFLVLDISDGGDVVVARPEIESFQQLKGRKVAVEAGALGAYVLTRALKLNGMQLSDVQIKHLEVNAHESAYLSGKVDAAVTFEPVRTKLLEAGAHELFTSREIPGEIVDVLVVHRDVIDEQQPNIRRLVGGWFHALDYMQQEPDKAATIIAERLRVSPQEVASSYEGLRLPDLEENLIMLDGPKAKLITTARQLESTMLEQSLLKQKVVTEKLFTSTFLK